MTKTVGNGLRIDVLVDTHDPSANGNGQELVRNCLADVVGIHAVAIGRKKTGHS